MCKMETAQKTDAALWPEASFHLLGELGVGYISVSSAEPELRFGTCPGRVKVPQKGFGQ